MRVLKICAGDWENASRDKRELSACREIGAKVLVLAKGNPEDRGRIDYVEGFKVIRYSTRPFNHIPIIVNRVLSIFFWASFVGRRIKPDVISGHNMDGWLIGWLSTFFSRGYKPHFVYDSHEFQLGIGGYKNRFHFLLTKFIENRIINKSDFTIVVNDSIADELVRIYRLKKRPIVVRSTPGKWVVDRNVCLETRNELIDMFGDGGKDDFILMYHGLVMEDREIESLIKLLSINDHIKAVVLGNGTKEYVDSLKELSLNLGVDDRIVFHPAVPMNELWKYVGAADAGMILIKASCKNHVYMLPNKYFENIQAGTPVLSSRQPELSKMIRKYKNGLLFDPEDINDINRCVERIRTDSELYSELKGNSLKAKDELCWENEKRKLINAYLEL